MRKVVKDDGDWVFLSCPYLFITSNNPFYLTSLQSVGTGSPVRGPSGLGPGVKLLHGSTCYNFPPRVRCVVILYGPMFANCLMAPLRTHWRIMCQSVRMSKTIETRKLETASPIYFLNGPGRTGGWNLRKEPTLLSDSMQMGRHWT